MSSAATKTTSSKRFLARGRVQGVFFRDSVRQAAERAGVAGWVANRDDGAVEGFLQGEVEVVAWLLDAIRSGPGRAQVESLEVGDAEPEEDLDGFRIV